jgi:hypothetical protein
VLDGNLRSLAQPPKVQDKSQMDVSRFLNRILGLKISRQNAVSVALWSQNLHGEFTVGCNWILLLFY